MSRSTPLLHVLLRINLVIMPVVAVIAFLDGEALFAAMVAGMGILSALLLRFDPGDAPPALRRSVIVTALAVGILGVVQLIGLL